MLLLITNKHYNINCTLETPWIFLHHAVFNIFPYRECSNVPVVVLDNYILWQLPLTKSTQVHCFGNIQAMYCTCAIWGWYFTLMFACHSATGLWKYLSSSSWNNIQLLTTLFQSVNGTKKHFSHMTGQLKTINLLNEFLRASIFTHCLCLHH